MSSPSLGRIHRQSHWPSQCSPLWFVVSSTSCSFRMPNFHASLFLVIYSTTPSISIVDCYTIGYLLSLIIIYRCGLKVMGVICNGNSANWHFYKLHSKGEVVYKLKNPFTSEDRPIIFLSDHLIKTMRNCWASQKRNL